jgi:hypothetical protein
MMARQNTSSTKEIPLATQREKGRLRQSCLYKYKGVVAYGEAVASDTVFAFFRRFGLVEEIMRWNRGGTCSVDQEIFFVLSLKLPLLRVRCDRGKDIVPCGPLLHCPTCITVTED